MAHSNGKTRRKKTLKRKKVLYTGYLSTRAVGVLKFCIRLQNSPPLADLPANFSSEIRYSPILPAFLSPDKGPPKLPQKATSIALLFCLRPYRALGNIRGYLHSDERKRVYFTEGLASIVLVNFKIERAREIREICDNCPLEFWPLEGGMLDSRDIVIDFPNQKGTRKAIELDLPLTKNPELSVYVEQITASLASLWASYEIYFPSEQETLVQLAIHTKNLIKLYHKISGGSSENFNKLTERKKLNAIISALVEVSAALSYAFAQGTSGSLPVLSNRSPFPHHSLLGIGGAIRALNKYTRYLESAFMARSAFDVIQDRYSKVKQVVPARIPDYQSGSEYKFSVPTDNRIEHFDEGKNYAQRDNLPLITHFSLRHGFMETKFAVTAASQALTAETLPEWTLMTLSHEIMHSRVRTIFQALFGKNWNGDSGEIISKSICDTFCKWHQNRKLLQKEETVADSLRNVILNFCCAIDSADNVQLEHQKANPTSLTPQMLNEVYTRHKHLAIELFVHFHDYYFVYACQSKMYVRSLWASWIKVAGPYERPAEYLTRSLATVACGSGLKSQQAFEFSKEILLEGLTALEAVNVKSPLFEEIRSLLASKSNNFVQADFVPCYYLIDTVRRFFASKTIASKIDRIESDPFADGSTSADDYTANIYVFGEEAAISPIRYSLATLFKTLTKQIPIDDPQWLSAWNYLVISS